MTLAEAHAAIAVIYRTGCLAAGLTDDQILYRDKALSAAQQALIEGTATPLRPWARLSINDNLREQETISNSSRRYVSQGILIVELYSVSGDGGRASDKTLIPAIRNPFEDSRQASLWFRRVRSSPIGPDGQWFHTNILADFIWDEVR